MANLPFTCKGCVDRYPGCHAECEKYNREKAEHERLKKLERIEHERKAYVYNRMFDNADGLVKRKKKLRGYRHF